MTTFTASLPRGRFHVDRKSRAAGKHRRVGAGLMVCRWLDLQRLRSEVSDPERSGAHRRPTNVASAEAGGSAGDGGGGQERVYRPCLDPPPLFLGRRAKGSCQVTTP